MIVRRIGPDAARQWRAIRLEALRVAPEAFSADLADWRARPLQDFAAQLAANPVFLAFDGEMPVGCITWLHDTDPSMARRGWIEAVFVSPTARGQGYGQALIAAAMADAAAAGKREIWLEVGASNAAAQSAYRRAGFEAMTGADRPSQSCGKCEVSMWRSLP